MLIGRYSKILKTFTLLWPLIFVSACAKQSRVDVPPYKPEAYKRIDEPAREEVSGIVKSRIHENTFWVHGDSGTEDKIYAIKEDGEIKSKKKKYGGAKVHGARNKDWEDITVGPDQTLIIADIGNNCFCREDLKLFFVPEPDPDDEEVEVFKEYEIKYPEDVLNSVGILVPEKSLNAEAVFMRGGKVHILSKNRSNPSTMLFRLDDPKEGVPNMLTYIDRFDVGELVTAADITTDESKVAVLTRESIWLFEPGDHDSIFDGKIYWLPLKGITQIESVTFSGDNLIVAEETGELFKIAINKLVEFKPDSK